MNKVVMIGRLTKDPETRYTQSGKAVGSFTLAVDRRGKKTDGQQTADFIPCAVWDKLAKIVANNLTKGSKIGIDGRLQVRTYDAQDGSKRYMTEVVVNELDFCDSKSPANKPNINGMPAAPDITEEIPF